MACPCSNNSKCACAAGCGCSDLPLSTCMPCTPPVCGNGDPCPETFSSGCAVYTGDSIMDLNILKGDRVDTIIQKLALLITNPGCAYPTSPCMSVLGLQSVNITATTASLKWLTVPIATSYQVEYRATTSVTWLLNPVVLNSANPIDLIGVLLPNTSYFVRVRTICGTSCYSLTILIKTLAV